MPFFTTLPFGKSTLEKAFSEAKSQSFVLFFQKRGGAKNPSNYFAILFLKVYIYEIYNHVICDFSNYYSSAVIFSILQND
jgi:hypothetical protein